MDGVSLVAVISVIGSVLVSVLTTCFHSRCSTIKTPCISCEREVIKDDKFFEDKEKSEENNINNKL
tara:strand:- start:384 stop:581 length:198 start_codon:yes stop_codon:yes gene_type:complete